MQNLIIKPLFNSQEPNNKTTFEKGQNVNFET